MTTIDRRASDIAERTQSAVDIWCGYGGNLAYQLMKLRRIDYKLVPTWLATLESTGNSLDPVAKAEIEVAKQRSYLYRSILDGLRLRWPDIKTCKAQTVDELYPAEIIRFSGDIDVVCSNRETVFAISEWLAQDGWIVNELTLLPVEGEDQIIVVLNKANPFQQQRAFKIELSTVEWVGNGKGVPALAALPESSMLVSSMVSVIGERLERDFQLRDVLDFSLMVDAATSDEVRHFVRQIEQLNVGPEVLEMAKLLKMIGTHSVEFVNKLGSVHAMRDRIKRTYRMMLLNIVSMCRPRYGIARYLQVRMLYGKRGSLTQKILSTLTESAPGLKACKYGLVVGGIPVRHVAQVDTNIHPDYILSTSLGDWLMTASPTLSSELLDHLGVEPRS